MDTALNATEISRPSAASKVVAIVPDDDLAFFHALWLWIPVALVLWSALVWLVMRIV